MRSFISRIGGKSLVARDIVRMMPPHRCYVEVFGGAAWVLFAKKRSRVEVYNDIDGELVNLFLVVRDSLDEFVERIRWLPSSRQLFDEFKDADPLKLGKIDRGARMYYMIFNSFNGNLDQFLYSREKPAKKFHLDYLRKIRRRLERVYIECLDFGEVLERYDGDDTFFYLDPPYWLNYSGGYRRYNYTFEREDHLHLREALGGVRGKWLLSYNAREEIKELYRGYQFQALEWTYSSSKKYGVIKPKGRELLISNYKARQMLLPMEVASR